MHLGAVTYNVLKDWDLETIIKKLEAAGFEAVELRTEHKHGVEPTLGKEERERVKQALRRQQNTPAELSAAPANSTRRTRRCESRTSKPGSVSWNSRTIRGHGA